MEQLSLVEEKRCGWPACEAVLAGPFARMQRYCGPRCQRRAKRARLKAERPDVWLAKKARYRSRIPYDKKRDAELRRTYGLTLEDYRALRASQGGVCAICGGPPTKGDFCVDHCHATGAVRGLLCGLCNHGLGQFRDTPEHLERAADYLRRARAARAA